MTDYKKLAEELAQIIHEKDMKPGPPEMGGPTTINFIGATADRIAAALERAAKEGEIRGMEACKELCGVDMDLPIGSFVQEFEIDAEIARMKGEEK